MLVLQTQDDWKANLATFMLETKYVDDGFGHLLSVAILPTIFKYRHKL